MYYCLRLFTFLRHHTVVDSLLALLYHFRPILGKVTGAVALCQVAPSQRNSRHKVSTFMGPFKIMTFLKSHFGPYLG